MWLEKAPATYKSALYMLLTKFKLKSFLFYIDDVIIYSTSVQDHIKHVDEILTSLVEFFVTSTIDKYTFFSDEVEYLWHVIRSGELEVDNPRTTSLR